MPNNAENTSPYRESTYHEFTKWFALPTPGKVQMGVTDQNEFAAQFKVSKDTLSRWKQRSDFKQRVDKFRRDWGDERTPNVIEAIYRSAMRILYLWNDNSFKCLSYLFFCFIHCLTTLQRKFKLEKCVLASPG